MADSDASREREVLKYYQPTPSTSYTYLQLPRSSHDSALNAFAQCAALRMRAKCCIVSLFTREDQYIIAEATRTLSSQNDDVHDKFDHLWRGVGVKKREEGPADGAFTFLCNPDRPEFACFPDLWNHPDYGTLPYVVDAPKMRFYVAVPIISPSKIRIGSFAVFDTVARSKVFGKPDLIKPELEFLKDMATTTMQHLEMCRNQQSNATSGRLIKGLGLYVEGKSSLREWWLVTGHKNQRRPAAQSMEQMADDEFGHQEPRRGETLRPEKLASAGENGRRPMPPRDDSVGSMSIISSNSGTSDYSYQDPKSTAPTSVGLTLQTPSLTPVMTRRDSMNSEGSEYGGTSTLSASRSRKARSNSGAARLQDAVLTDELKDTFSNASNLIREAMSVEGCLFLDASVGSFGAAGTEMSISHKAPGSWKTSKSPLVTSSSDEDTRGRPTEPVAQDPQDPSVVTAIRDQSVPTSEYSDVTVKRDQSVSTSGHSDVTVKIAQPISNSAEDYLQIVDDVRSEMSQDPFGTSKEHARSNSKSGQSTRLFSENDSAQVTQSVDDFKTSEARAPFETPLAKCCGILGYSTSTRSSLNMHQGSDRHLSVREAFLQNLLKRYPHGKVFNFDEDGNVSADEDKTLRTVRSAIHITDNRAPTERREHRRLRRKKQANAEAQEIAEILPGVRSVAFFPLWDSHQERFYAGCFVWSTNVTRLLDPDDDLVYLAAFGNSIMAEVSRLNAIIAAQMKISFVSSISHELRSPLHGILASTEFLQDMDMSFSQANMVNTINACGRTLLDTIDHVLDFSKLTASGSTKNQKVKKAASRSRGPLNRKRSSTPVPTQSKSNISLLTEEVVESVYAGYGLNKYTSRHRTMSTAVIEKSGDKGLNSSQQEVLLIVDIAQSSNWSVNIEPGAWRRILMNLLSNALKYTDNGYIKVTLEQTDSQGTAKGSSTVVLNVRDSGKGISESFLRHHLFTPFAQEDSLSAGTGLGLSIVRTLVGEIGGSINFTSEQGTGTEAKIYLPMATSKPSTSPLTGDAKLLAEVQVKTQGMKACLVGFNPAMPAEATGILSSDVQGMFYLKSSISELLTQWFGMHIVHSSSLDISLATMSCIMESALNDMSWDATDEGLEEQCLSTPGFPSKPILLVVCTTISQEHSFTSRKGGYNVVYLQQPLGPHKLALTLARCFTIEESASGEEVDPTIRGGDFQPTSPTSDANYFPRYPRVDSRSPPPSRPQLLGTPSTYSVPKRTSSNRGSDSTPKSPLSAEIVQNADGSVKSKVSSPSDEDQKTSDYIQNVLLVEDNAINLNLLVMYIKKLGLDYAKAVNGLEALRIFRDAEAKPFDIIFMDISMPVMNGLQASIEIRKLEHERGQKATTIVALTGATSEASKQEAYSAGIDLFLTKPVPMKSLKGILEENVVEMQNLKKMQRDR